MIVDHPMPLILSKAAPVIETTFDAVLCIVVVGME